MALPSAPIDQFEEYNDPIEGDWLVIFDVRTGKTKKINSKYFIPAPPSTNYNWVSSFDYAVNDAVYYNAKWYKSLLTPNVGHLPSEPSSIYWEEINKSQSGFVYWQAGVFTQADVIVLKKTTGITDIYELIDPTRPFISTDFDAELAATKWRKMTGSSGSSFPNPLTTNLIWDDADHLWLVQGSGQKILSRIDLTDRSQSAVVEDGHTTIEAVGTPSGTIGTRAAFDSFNDGTELLSRMAATQIDPVTPANNLGFKIDMQALAGGTFKLVHYKAAVQVIKIQIDQATGAISLDGGAGTIGNIIRKTATGWTWDAENASPYRGTFASSAALTTAIPTGNSGDYAFIDGGVGVDAQIWIWDANDTAWKQGGAGAVLTWTTTVPGIVERSTTAEAQNVVTRALAGSSDASNSDARTPSEKGLVEMLLSFLAAAWTWAAKQTFTSAPRFSSVTASHFLKSDGSKDLISVAPATPAEVIAAIDNTKPITPASLASSGISTGSDLFQFYNYY